MKSLVSLLLHVALGIFFIMAILPAMKGSNEGYTGAVAVAPTVVVEEEAVEAEPEVVADEQAPVVTDTAKKTAENENEEALYSVVDGNKLDAGSYAGYELYRNTCAVCHGTYAQGMIGPNLAESLKVITEKEFFNVVENGKTGTIGMMPPWKTNMKVMDGRDQLYAYLMARSDGAIGEEKPLEQ